MRFPYAGLFAEPDGACADEQGNGDYKESVIERLDEGLAANGSLDRSFFIREEKMATQCGLQVTDTKQTTIEVRALVSASDPGKVFDLRCEVREGLIGFLCRNYPESLPRQRSVSEPSDEENQHRQRPKSASTAQGKEHERGPKAPGIHAEADGAGADGQLSAIKGSQEFPLR